MTKTPRKKQEPQVRKVVGLQTGRQLGDGRYALALECGHIVIGFREVEQAVCPRCTAQ